jgi:hypothetical protein
MLDQQFLCLNDPKAILMELVVLVSSKRVGQVLKRIRTYSKFGEINT